MRNHDGRIENPIAREKNLPKEWPSKDYYDRLAMQLHENPQRIHAVPERQLELNQLVNEVCEYFRGDEVFELACGIGFWTEKLQLYAKSVHASDKSVSAIEICKKRIPSFGVAFSQVDALSIADLPPTISGVFAGFLISHLKRTELVHFFNQLHSKCQPGTKFYFVDNYYPSGAIRPYPTVERYGNTYELRILLDGTEHYVIKNNYKTKDYIDAIGAYRAISIECKQYYFSISYIM